MSVLHHVMFVWAFCSPRGQLTELGPLSKARLLLAEALPLVQSSSERADNHLASLLELSINTLCLQSGVISSPHQIGQKLFTKYFWEV